MIANESKALAFLRRQNLFGNEEAVKGCRCESEMKDITREKTVKLAHLCDARINGVSILLSPNRKCLLYFANFSGIMTCNLKLGRVLELYYFIEDISFDTVHELSGRDMQTVRDWFNICRGICTQVILELPLFYKKS